MASETDFRLAERRPIQGCVFDYYPPVGNRETIFSTTATSDSATYSAGGAVFSCGQNTVYADANRFSFAPNGPCSFAAWFKSANTNDSTILSKVGEWAFYYKRTVTVAGPSLCRYNSAGGGYIVGMASNPFSNNTIYHLVFTLTAGALTTTNCKVYVNGVSQTITDRFFGPTYSVMSNLTNPLYVGSENPDRYFNGTIYRAQIYDRVLSQAEVTAMYVARY